MSCSALTSRLRVSTPDFLSWFTPLAFHVALTHKAAGVCGQGILPLDELPFRVVESHLPEFEAGVFMCQMPLGTALS